MAESRHRTTIQVDVDDRAVRKLGQEIERAIDPRLLDAFTRSIERSNRAIDRLTRATERMARVSDKLARASMGGGMGGGRGRGKPETGRQARMRDRVQRFVSAAGGPAGGEGFIGGAFGMIPYAGPVLQSAISGAQGYYQQYIAAQQARMQSFGAAGIARPGDALSSRLRGIGYGPGAQAGVLGQIAQMSGRRGAGLSSIAGDAATMERFLGVNPAAIFRGAEVQGPQSNDLMQSALGAARQAGFRDPMLTEAIQGLSQTMMQLQQEGIQLAPQAILGIYRGLGAAQLPGLRGEAVAGLAQRIVGAGGNVGGGSSSFDYLMLQAAGGGRGGDRSLLQAQIFAERNPGEVFFNVLEQLRGRAGNNPAEQEALAEYLHQNVGVSRDLALQLAQMDPGRIQQMRAASSNQVGGVGDLGSWLQSNIEGAGQTLSAVRTEAGLESQRVGIGGAVAESVTAIQQAEIQLIRVFMPAALSLVRGVMNGAEKLVAAFREGGVAGVMTRLAEMSATAAGNALDPVATAATNALNDAADAAEGVLGAGDPMVQGLRALGQGISQQTPVGGTTAGGLPRTNQRGIGPPPGTTQGAPTGGGGPGTEPGGVGPLSRLQGHLEGAAHEVGRLRRQGMVGDEDLQALS